jgi:hypothetical protein
MRITDLNILTVSIKTKQCRELNGIMPQISINGTNFQHRDTCDDRMFFFVWFQHRFFSKDVLM